MTNHDDSSREHWPSWAWWAWLMPFLSEVRLNVLKSEETSFPRWLAARQFVHLGGERCECVQDRSWTHLIFHMVYCSHVGISTQKGRFHFFNRREKKKKKNTPSCKRSTGQINPISSEINLSCQEGRGVIPFVKWLLNLCFRLRCLVKQLERGEASLTDLKKNLEYAASVLESVYIEETRWENWSSLPRDKFWQSSFMGNNRNGLTKARLWKMDDY